MWSNRRTQKLNHESNEKATDRGLGLVIRGSEDPGAGNPGGRGAGGVDAFSGKHQIGGTMTPYANHITSPGSCVMNLKHVVFLIIFCLSIAGVCRAADEKLDLETLDAATLRIMVQTLLRQNKRLHEKVDRLKIELREAKNQGADRTEGVTQTAPNFVHGAYLVGDRIKGRAQLDQMRFEQFNLMYVMAGPRWKPEDFEMSDEAVMTKLVKGHAYPTGDRGSALIPELIERAHRKNVAVLLSIPGREQFNPVVGDRRKRALFARVMAGFVKKYHFDGIEIDWEHTLDVDQHIALMGALREALDALEQGDSPRKYYVTTALHTFLRYSEAQATELVRHVDWINLMTYDMGGGVWGHVPSHNTPLDQMKKALDRWSIFPKDKLCIGLANYGFRYHGILPGERSEVVLKQKGRYFSYTELPGLLKEGWKETYDATAQAPYYISPNRDGFVTIDNRRSLNQKLKWVFKERFRGVFWWEFHIDYFPPAQNQKYAHHPLMDPVTDAIAKKQSKALPNWE